MSTLTSGRGSSISQHLHAMKKILQNMVYDARYVRGSEVPCARTDVRVCRTSVAPDKAEVTQTSGTHVWVVTDVYILPARRSRARHSRDPPPDTIVEKRSRPNQPNPPRNPLPPSGLLGSTLWRLERNCANPCVSGLETGIHVSAFFLGRSRLRRPRGQNSCLPQTLKILSHQIITIQRRRSTSTRRLLSNHPPSYWTTQVSVRPGNARKSAKYLPPTVTPCSYS